MANELPEDILDGWIVLVVDDDPNSLDIASTLLRHYGATVFTAVNGHEALAVLSEVQPHFIISDLSMPVMDGWTFIKTLKANRATADVPVIALTAENWMEGRQRAIASGFHNYLTKPLTATTFVRDLLSLLVDIPDFADHFNF